ncbi:DNA polymerase III subunit alpha [Mesoplasma photuris]|uniref:DNA polymerase III subunit alpha n=1 Tax=Mesoplasma photuris TaxID=217731 RepID=UPI0004E26E80|nr:DNA polymerase III subunit alpha [Mesoplasma photuris]
MNYISHFNIRSAYNFQESFIKIDDYISFAQTNNLNVLFYSEKETMYGVAEFVKKATAVNIKPIIGITIMLEEFKINLYPLNSDGYKKILFISSKLSSNKMTNEQKIELMFKNINSNIFVISNFNNLDEQIINIVGNENFINTNNAKIYFRDINYFYNEEFQDFKVLMGIKNNLTINDHILVEKAHYPKNEDLRNYNFDNHNSLVNLIASKVNLNIFENNEQHFIKYKTPNNMPSKTFMRELCLNNLKMYLSNFSPVKSEQEYLNRLDFELEVINSMNFNDYFLVVWDYVKFAKDNGIIVGPGRGSAAGSLVSFLLNITEVDPLKFDLLFERFLNPERITLPDIDIDFQDDRRDLVIEYLFEKYGVYNVGTIVTYQTIGMKMALKDVGRFFGHEVSLMNEITKHAPVKNDQSPDEIIANNEKLKMYSKVYPEIFSVAKKLNSLPRQTGTHAAGIILSDKDLREILPIKIGYNGINQTQYDMNFLEDLGLIKMDILGLKNLRTIQEIRATVLRTRKLSIDLRKIPLNDQATFNELQKGNTSGIFQLESEGMTNLAMQMKVNSLEDISTVSALYRPGPQEFIPEYLKRKNSNLNNYLIDESLSEILRPTYGIIVYQEQVIQMLQKVANFSLAKADVVRRAMGKKNYEYMNSVHQEFLLEAIKNGYTEEKAITIWQWISKFAEYGFNKSHSIAYSLISYWLAYFKTHYTEEFYSSLLNSVIGDSVKTNQYIKELNQYGIKIKTPTVKSINFGYVPSNKVIFMPLTSIKGISREMVKIFREAHQLNSDVFENLTLFITFMHNKGLTKSKFALLAKAGVFDNFGYNRLTILENIDAIYNKAQATTGIDDPLAKFPLLLDEITIDEMLISEFEKEMYGFYINGDPIIRFKNENAISKPVDLIVAKNKIQTCNILVRVEDIKIIKDKNNLEMAFVKLTDNTDSIDMTIFSSSFENIKYDLTLDMILILEIKIEKYNQNVKAVFNKIVKIVKK